ncbi:16S rRNA (cytosine(1402)-N(4))-methyltransferase RsmH [Mycolicibacterium helvum]|uniref:16S rRNA (cytosine(1402)-N(4))-methyltransferase RsmH n=1 Tax=Mycolicibacterium helvum TaxID=1534349 RepID=UPI0015D1CD4A|nr:16S rRNA (cytosine(1402)-N(4))-methyltransferase RsmH [Mycolicibacterium helvum]
MKHSATSFELAAQPEVARASWPLPEPTLTYFPNARFAISDRDLDSRVHRAHLPGGPVVVDESGPESDHGHVPVLLERCVEILAPALARPGAVLVDGTLGAGGHAERFLTAFPELRLIGLDRDPGALAIAGARLAPFADRIALVHTRYDGIADALAEAGCATTDSIDGVLLDLGVSSMQLDQIDRGFSYSKDAPLDMRMDTDAPLTAAEILNTYDRGALTDILRRFGEEKFAQRIAGLIVEQRQKAPLTTTGELVEIIYRGIPAPARRTGGHPAKRTFQALRIAVNAELDSLSEALPAALAALRPGGRIVVMSYQSLEDRIVKTTFAAATASRSPAGLPIELPGYEPEFSAITRGAERADAEEIERNPRSAPVRLRALQRVAPGNPRRGGKS